MKPLGDDYAANVVKLWPAEAHAQGVLDHLPSEIDECLKEQNEDFLDGWFNAMALIHDMGIKIMIGELVKRTGGVATEERDLLLTNVGGVVEGLCFLACREKMNRKGTPNDDESERGEDGS